VSKTRRRFVTSTDDNINRDLLRRWVRVDNDRLSRVEAQLELIVSRLEALVRLEERHDSALRRLDRVEAQGDAQAIRIDALEKTSASNSHTNRAVERGFWIVATAIMSAGVYWFNVH